MCDTLEQLQQKINKIGDSSEINELIEGYPLLQRLLIVLRDTRDESDIAKCITSMKRGDFLAICREKDAYSTVILVACLASGLIAVVTVRIISCYT